MFISFEGTEGCGKSTQIHLLSEYLKQHSIPFISSREPGGTSLGKEIRSLLLNPETKNLSSLSEILLYAADRAQHCYEIIQPALDAKKWVLCDRFIDSTTAYQAFGRGLALELINLLNTQSTGGLKPDFTFLLHLSVEEGLKRAQNRAQKNGESLDRFEQLDLSFHKRVETGYLELAQKDKKRIYLIDAQESPESIHQNILQILKKNAQLCYYPGGDHALPLKTPIG